MNNNNVKITECPRDAMQGMHDFIPTQTKIDYINSLLKVGFDTIDAGSFVSPKAIPQLKDTAEVFSKLDLSGSSSKILAIVANLRGAQDAAAFELVNYLGYPFSISETFQLRNTNATIAQSLDRVKEIQDVCVKNKKELLIYISMAFGNPYGDPWNSDIAIEWTEKLSQLGIKSFAMADTVGVSTPENISYLFSKLIPKFSELKIGAHLHSRPEASFEKIRAAYDSGCRNFDAAVKGFGGCPMAEDELVGNIATETLIEYFDQNKITTGIDNEKFTLALGASSVVFQ